MKHYNTIIRAILVFFAALAVVGAGLYYLVGFGWLSMGVAMLAAVGVSFVSLRGVQRPKQSLPAGRQVEIASVTTFPRNDRTLYVALAVFSLDLVALAALVIFRTTDALRSPWEVVPPVYFILFWTASLLLLVVSRRSSWALPLATLHTFTGWSVALLVYQIGFGFDPFIHQAAEKIIAADGVVRPLTPYYIGQYVIVVTLHRLTTIPLDLIDRWLLPVLASIAVPYLLHSWSSRREPALERGLTSATPTFSLAPLATLIPATTFIMTTPQGLGNLWLLLTAFTLAKKVPISNYQLPTIFALAALATHPIAGIPAIALVAFSSPSLLPSPRGRELKGGGLGIGIGGLVFLATALSLPAAFALQRFATIRPHVPSFDFTRLLPIIQNHYDWPLDFVNLVGKNMWLAVIVLAAVGYRRARQATHLVVAAALFVSYLITTTLLDFGGIIGYETAIFPKRLLEVGTIALLPLVAVGLDVILRHSERNEESSRRSFVSLRMTGAILLASLMSASIYLTYPRVDKYEKNSGWSLSPGIVEAVHWIENQRPPPPPSSPLQGEESNIIPLPSGERLGEGAKRYIVLADQNAAAAQIRDYGFGPYYHNNYFYSHASGGLGFYRYYLRIMDDREDPGLVAREAMDWTGVDTLYLLVPDYWKGARHVISSAQTETSAWQNIENGKILIFKFQK